jgi:hypothetical protein
VLSHAAVLAGDQTVTADSARDVLVAHLLSDAQRRAGVERTDGAVSQLAPSRCAAARGQVFRAGDRGPITAPLLMDHSRHGRSAHRLIADLGVDGRGDG